MKTLNNGSQVEILKTFKGQSNNYTDDNSKQFADLLKVRLSSGKVVIVCSTELNK